MLRAERSSPDVERVYTIEYAAVDKSGNRATKTLTVRVAPDRQ